MNICISLRSYILFALCCVHLGYCAHIRDLNKDNRTATTRTSAISTTRCDANQIVNQLSVADEKCREYSNMIYNVKNNNPVSGLNAAYRSIDKTYCNITTFIVGGKKAVSKEFPHMVLLSYAADEGINQWHCGGSLISERWVLTAAHCLHEDFNDDDSETPLWARLGELNYLSYTDDTRPKNYEIVQRVIHPSYKPSSLYNDVALLRLESDVEFSVYVRPICLNTERSLKVSTAVATGWGRTDIHGPTNADLLKAVLDIFPINRCTSIYPISKYLSHGIDDKTMICTGNGGKNVCKGDSGSALQIEHPKYICMYSQIGVTSFGYKCGKYDEPSVFTKVSSYVPWIEKHVWPITEQRREDSK